MSFWYPVILMLQGNGKCLFKKEHINKIYTKFSISQHQNKTFWSSLACENSLSKTGNFLCRTRYNVRKWTYEGTSRSAKSLLDQGFIHSIGLNEQWKSLEWFGWLSLRFWDIVFLLTFFSKSRGPSQVQRKIKFRISTCNFAQL